MTITSLMAFVAAATLLTITPGLDTALVLRSAAIGGPRPAASAALGIALGCLAWGAAASVGLAALLAASNLAYAILKWIGAAYLFWVGVTLIMRPRSVFAVDSSNIQPAPGAQSFRRGLLTNLLNPKVGIFYVSFLPQFIPLTAHVAEASLALAAIHVAIGLLWFALLIAATASIGRFLRRSKVVRAMDRLTGSIFVLFGAKLAFGRP